MAADGHEIPLTRAEFSLLSVLIRARGRALSRDQILEAVAGLQTATSAAETRFRMPQNGAGCGPKLVPWTVRLRDTPF